MSIENMSHENISGEKDKSSIKDKKSIEREEAIEENEENENNLENEIDSNKLLEMDKNEELDKAKDKLSERSYNISNRIKILEDKDPAYYEGLVIEGDIAKEIPGVEDKLEKFEENFEQVEKLYTEAEEIKEKFEAGEASLDEVNNALDKVEEAIVRTEILVNKDEDLKKLKQLYEKRKESLEKFMENFKSYIKQEIIANNRYEDMLGEKKVFSDFVESVENGENEGNLGKEEKIALDLYKKMEQMSDQYYNSNNNLVRGLGLSHISNIDKLKFNFKFKNELDNSNKLSPAEIQNILAREKGYLNDDYLTNFDKTLDEFNKHSSTVEQKLKNKEKKENQKKYKLLRKKALDIKKKYEKEYKAYLDNPDDDYDESWQKFNRILREKYDFGVIEDNSGKEAIEEIEELFQSIREENEESKAAMKSYDREKKLEQVTEEAEQLIESVEEILESSNRSKSRYAKKFKKTLKERILGVKTNYTVESALTFLQDVLDEDPDNLQKIINAKNNLEQAIKKEWG